MIANLNGMRLDGSQAPLEVRLSVGCVLGQSTPFRSMAGYAHGTRFVFSLYYPFTFVVGYAISRGLFLPKVNFYICLMKWISLHVLTLAWWIRWEWRDVPDLTLKPVTQYFRLSERYCGARFCPKRTLLRMRFDSKPTSTTTSTSTWTRCSYASSLFDMAKRSADRTV